MPTDEELVRLARTTPAFKHHLTNPSVLFTTPPPDLDIADTPPEPSTDPSTDEELLVMAPALRTHRDPTIAAMLADTDTEES